MTDEPKHIVRTGELDWSQVWRGRPYSGWDAGLAEQAGQDKGRAGNRDA